MSLEKMAYQLFNLTHTGSTKCVTMFVFLVSKHVPCWNPDNSILVIVLCGGIAVLLLVAFAVGMKCLLRRDMGKVSLIQYLVQYTVV